HRPAGRRGTGDSEIYYRYRPAKFQPRLCSGIVRSCRRARPPHARAHSRSPTTDLGFSWNNRQTPVSPAGSGRIRGSWQKTAGRWIFGGSVARISRRTHSAVSEQRRGDWSELLDRKSTRLNSSHVAISY